MLGQETTEGATALTFSPDSSRFIIGTAQSSSLIILSVEGKSEPKVLRVFDHHRQANSMNTLKDVRGQIHVDMGEDDAKEQSSYARITTLATSADGQWLASSDTDGWINVFNLDGIQVSLSH